MFKNVGVALRRPHLRSHSNIGTGKLGERMGESVRFAVDGRSTQMIPYLSTIVSLYCIARLLGLAEDVRRRNRIDKEDSGINR